jgi:tetratricopeptide (TPR) repeat protein
MTDYTIYGLFSIAEMYFNIARKLEQKDKSQTEYNEEIEYFYLSSANLKYSPAMVNIAIHYEEIYNDYDKAIPYYLEAIEYDELNAMYNLADLYDKMKDFDKMEYYYLLAINRYNDIESIYKLISYYTTYTTQFNFDKIKYYYLIAIEHSHFKRNKVKKIINIFYIFLILNDITNKTPRMVLQLSRLMKNCDIMIYKNKIKLFTNLNNIIECVICYETLLNIDLHCGHCVCIYCYPKVFEESCPICRL